MTSPRKHSQLKKIQESTSYVVPTIDLSGLKQKRPEIDRQIALQVMNAFEEYGMAILVNHGISQRRMDEVLKQSKKFFRLPKDIKLKYTYKSHESNRGYIPLGMEAVYKGQPDKKETMDIGKEGEVGMENQWPEEVSDFKPTMIDFFEEMDELQLNILRCIEIGLNLEKGTITKDCNQQHENLRLLHYPQCITQGRSNTQMSRCGEHTDYGSLTFILQDNVGGLQIRTRDGEWHDVAPVPGAIVVQVADMLHRWTNGLLHSARHRVIAPEAIRYRTHTVVPERFSVAFFCNPNKDTMIKALPNTFSDSNPPKYKPFNAYHYLCTRLRASL